ncbi:hypothetical protein LX15_001582 [Streptoalloteichus tenebrarius]|uniref:Uncharacterized protein n=1 Tax=Streptoalloteichus tenebrarius (strain ATCC 17920 / DSM 40477 / JCM 4838 / CBS 697.72 / NBRC 16177 / NCIMB 11028 / NRRL B-12390 / A12253. 1 / ISP 5477) TaxID=1933 RepID=A0ABT1HQV2_STRSD|nr:hypothetical protein [Streptoalloteichus tenebrarius]
MAVTTMSGQALPAGVGAPGGAPPRDSSSVYCPQWTKLAAVPAVSSVFPVSIVSIVSVPRSLFLVRMTSAARRRPGRPTR